jgi:histidinol-phosphate phosphatase family protein
MPGRPAVLLDRDGTMIRDVGYLDRPESLEWYPWTLDAVRLLNRAGFVVCVTTNQGGIGLGLYSDAFVRELHAGMGETLKAAGARVDGWFYCPHHPRAELDALRVECDCRKPAPGMARRAAERFDLDLTASYVVGDKASDVGLANGVGARGVMVRTGHGEQELMGRGGTMPEAAHVAADLMEATSWILGRSGHRRDGA